MKRRPAPVVGDDLTAVQQQPAEHLGVASAGGEVHRRGAIAVPVREADLRKTHLEGEENQGVVELVERVSLSPFKCKIFTSFVALAATYQPDDDGVVAHLGGSVQGSHPVVGPDAGLCPAVLHQVLDDLQVTLLAGQVERRGTILSLRVDNTGRKQGSHQ